MQEPTLVILAAGMGRRYGGLKQIDPVDEYGNLIIDYSLYDALQAGFKRVVCIINKSIEHDFNEMIGHRITAYAELLLAFQETDMLPSGYTVPEGRVKPWGTAHALWCSKGTIDGPFAVINADDYYGKSAFSIIHGYLTAPHRLGEFAMVGYALENTLTDYGTVARGVCDVSADGYLTRIQERIGIRKHAGGGAFELDGREIVIHPGTTVSMNLWGFDPSILQTLEEGLPAFFKDNVPADPLKSEYLLPAVVQKMLRNKTASVRVLKSLDKWYGVTYVEDMPIMRSALRKLKKQGVYPEKLWR